MGQARVAEFIAHRNRLTNIVTEADTAEDRGRYTRATFTRAIATVFRYRF